MPAAVQAQDEEAREAAYLPESWDVERHGQFIVGTVLLVTDETTYAPSLPGDLLWGFSVGHRWGWFELAGQLAAGLSWRNGIEYMRFYAALEPRAAIPIHDFGFLDFEITYGLGISVEMKFGDDYGLLHLTPMELGLLLWDRGSWRVNLLGSLRILVAGVRMNGLVGQTSAIEPESTDARIEELLSQPVGFVFGLAFTRAL